MENQGKKKSQIKDSETFAIIALIAALVSVLVMLTSCGTEAQTTPQEDEKVYINIDGLNVEIVADEYGGQYLKQYISHGSIIYIPYPGETEDSDTLQFYNVKN